MRSPIPEEAEVNTNDYFDIMIIGRTGMGKSTTSDKLLMANLAGDTHHHRVQSASEALNIEQVVKLGDFSMWQISDTEGECEVHLKNLMTFQSTENPHQKVNNLYKGSKKPTSRSRLISNEITKVRILDVPGFFGKDASTDRMQAIGHRVTLSGLRIMREVLRIQSTMRIKFKRIIYFIPQRGTLEQLNEGLLMELEQMVHYFGKSIFECMVLVATISPNVYQCIQLDVVPFSKDDEMTTRKSFQEALTQVLPQGEQLPDGKPPIVFISMHDSCEIIMAKIKDAPVLCKELRLELDHRMCVRCGLKAKILTYKNNRRERVACYIGQDPSVSMPYEESLCHPLIVSKYWTITKIVGGIAHFITRGNYHGKWPNFHNDDDEVCIECGRLPGETGCKKVGSRYRIEPEGAAFVIDHTPIVPVAVIDQQQQPIEGEVHIAMPLPVQPDEPQQLPPAAKGENENVAMVDNPTEQDVNADQQRIRGDIHNVGSMEYDEHRQHEQQAGNAAAEPLDQHQPAGADGMQIVAAADIQHTESDEHQQYEQEKPVGEGESVHTRLDATKSQVQQLESGACRTGNKDSEDPSNEQPQPQPIAIGIDKYNSS